MKSQKVNFKVFCQAFSQKSVKILGVDFCAFDFKPTFYGLINLDGDMKSQKDDAQAHSCDFAQIMPPQLPITLDLS